MTAPRRLPLDRRRGPSPPALTQDYRRAAQSSVLQSRVSTISCTSAEERAGVGAVDRAVVERQAEVADRRDARAGRASSTTTCFETPSVARIADLRLVDDRERDPRARPARVRDRERAAREVVGRELASPGPGVATSWIAAASARSRSPSASRTTGTTRPWKSRSTAMPRLNAAVHDAASSPSTRGVHERILAQRVDDGPRDERQVGEREAFRARHSARLAADRLDRASSRPRRRTACAPRSASTRAATARRACGRC